MVEYELSTIVTMVSQLATALGVCIAATYYVMTLRNADKTRQAQLFMPIYNNFSSKEFQRSANETIEWSWIDYDDYLSKYSYQANPEAASSRSNLVMFFEGIGVLVKRKLIDPSMVDDLLSIYIIGFWEKFGPIFIEQRKRQNAPTVAEYTEYLYQQVKSIWLSQHSELKK